MQATDIRKVLQGVLNNKVIQMKAAGCEKYSDMHSRAIQDWLFVLIDDNRSHISFRVKPETKVVKYRTRLYSVGATPNRAAYLWSDKTGCYSQSTLERSYTTLEWLQPTQEHVFEYEEEV